MEEQGTQKERVKQEENNNNNSFGLVWVGEGAGRGMDNFQGERVEVEMT